MQAGTSTSAQRPIRWGILGTANIARAQFLPALRVAGGGATMVASRDLDKAQAWAAEHGVAHAVAGYDRMLAGDEVDAVYIALPNHLHAEWSEAALRAGKAVLCEKPLCTSVAETESLLAVVRETQGLLWEAFVFPFHRQLRRIHELLADDAIGDLREIQSNFYFKLRNRQNIRLSPEMYGGALNDVGCYSIRLAQLLFHSVPESALATASWAPEGVDEEFQGILSYPDKRHLSFACGLLRPFDTFTRLLGTEGEIRLSNPFHPSLADTLEIGAGGRAITEHPTPAEPSFTGMIRHIHAVLHGDEAPRHSAADDSLLTAQTLSLLHDRAGSPPV